VSQMTRAGEIINDLSQTSPKVIAHMCRLMKNVSESDRTVIENRLRYEYETALYEGNITERLVTPLASLLASSTVVGVHVVLTRRGNSLIVYFLCSTVKALFKLGQMITSGFLHAVFAEIIEVLTRTTVDVDVYARADEFNHRLACLSFLQNKGRSFDKHLLIWKHWQEFIT